MKNIFNTDALKSTTAKAVSFTAKHTHFIVQSTADAVAHTEGYLNSRLTNKSAVKIKAKRRSATKYTKATIKHRTSLLSAALTAKYDPAV